MKPKILLIGLGNLGSVLLELLARVENIAEIIVGSRDEKNGLARCNLTQSGAVAQGFFTDIRFTRIELNNKEQTAQVIQLEKPDLIISTATKQSWWLPNLLPPEQAALLNSAGFGMWLPVHLTLSKKLMEAVRLADYKGLTLTASFPDVINHILGRINLAPTCGVGNIGEVVPKIQLLAAKRLNVSLDTIRVIMVSHHALQKFTQHHESLTPSVETPPFYLRIEHQGKDVTEELDARELLFSPYPLTPGLAIHFITAATSVRLIQALFSEGYTLQHVPAPYGLPGGYPVMASTAGIQLLEIPNLTHEEAVAINSQSHRFDGIERIEPDGTAVFCPDSAAIFRKTLGYDCQQLPPEDTEFRANELIQRFKEYAQRYGVDLQ